MKLAVAGKGGVGKTLISGTLSRLFGQDGYRVLAIDADPAMNLSYTLGISKEIVEKIIPLMENNDLIKEKTKISSGSFQGGAFKLNPTVDDIADRIGVKGPDNVSLIVMGTVRTGGSGCMCPANTLTRALLRHITLDRNDIVIMDMQAGLEHLGRATTRGFTSLVCVAEPGFQSIETVQKIKSLAEDIDLREVVCVGNKIASIEDQRFVEDSLRRMNLETLAFIPFDTNIMRADARRFAPIDFFPNSPAIETIKQLKMVLTERYE